MDAQVMDARAPAVVAVLATRDPGPWFDETLAALAAQDYEELSVLVLVSGEGEDPTARIGRALPEAFVRRIEGARGYGASINEVLGMVEGAAFFRLCHDDCVPDPDTLHLLVEESYRSNAGVVCPKMVRWEDPSVLLHVGMSADKTGAVVERVQAGEVDHGQHDAVRDVFVAPGGFTLVRADLLRELGGYDAGILAMGEDLDLSWRAQIAGSRVVVAPDARVRHLEALAGGLRQLARPSGPAGAEEMAPVSLQAFQRRHELRTVLKCYTIFHLIRVLPQAVLLAVGEVVVALAVGDRVRARAVTGAWLWNLRRLGELRRLRAGVKAQRSFPDGEVRRLQLRGSARLSTYLSRLAYQGFDVAHGRTPSSVEGASGEDLDAIAEPVLTGSVGLAFSEDTDFDELDDLGHRAGRDRFGRRRRRPVLGSRRSRLAVWAVAAIVLAVGTRDLVAGGLPLVGQFLPLLSWTGSWHHLVAGWQSPGVGTTAPATPAFGVLGVLGTLLLGGMGLLQKVLVLGCIPVGAWGISRLLRPLASPRARLVAAICYLGLPLPYDALARGRWDGLVAYAAVPWILSRLARASGSAPFGTAPGPSGWRGTLPGQMVTLGVVEAVAVAFAPAIAVVVLLCGAGVVLGSALIGDRRGSVRVLATAGGATVVAAVLCAPWVVGTVLAGRSAVSVLGLAGSPASAPSWSQLLRFAVGPTGGSPLSWLLLAAALVPLLIGRQARLAWAGRLWTVACGSWVLALVVARGWTVPFAPSIDVLLVPAAAAVACGVGLGVSAFETDLSGYRFGWRQVVTVAAVAAAVVGMLPVVAEAAGGRWGLPVTGYSQSLSFLSPSTSGATQASYRVLWLGDPRALPIGGWSIAPGLAYATSEDGTPDATDLWAPASPGPAEELGQAVDLARQGRTTRLGQLLAPAAVRYVVVVETVAPEITGVQQAQAFPAPAGLVTSLLDQGDLRQVPSDGSGYSVFENTAYVPERSERSGGPVTSTGTGSSGPRRWPSTADVVGWRPVLPGDPGSHSYTGPVGKGTVLASYAPARDWHLTVNGREVPESSAFGWAAQYAAVPAGQASLRFRISPLVPLAVLAELALWVVVALALLGRRRWLDWWWQPMRRRRRRRGRRGASRGRHGGGSVGRAEVGPGQVGPAGAGQ